MVAFKVLVRLELASGQFTSQDCEVNVSAYWTVNLFSLASLSLEFLNFEILKFNLGEKVLET